MRKFFGTLSAGMSVKKKKTEKRRDMRFRIWLVCWNAYMAREAQSQVLDRHAEREQKDTNASTTTRDEKEMWLIFNRLHRCRPIAHPGRPSRKFESKNGFSLLEGPLSPVTLLDSKSGQSGKDLKESTLVDQWIHLVESEVATNIFIVWRLVTGKIVPYFKPTGNVHTPPRRPADLAALWNGSTVSYAILRVDFKDNDVLTLTFMPSNQIGGFFNHAQVQIVLQFRDLGRTGYERGRGRIRFGIVIHIVALENAAEKEFFAVALSWDLEIDGKNEFRSPHCILLVGSSSVAVPEISQLFWSRVHWEANHARLVKCIQHFLGRCVILPSRHWLSTDRDNTADQNSRCSGMGRVSEIGIHHKNHVAEIPMCEQNDSRCPGTLMAG